jgi:hypothetical protein
LESKPVALSLPVRLAIAAATIALWLVSVFYHHEGGQLFAAFFHYASGHWGPSADPIVGQKVAERVIFWVAVAMGGTVFGISAFKLLRAPGGRKAAPELAARWIAWFLFTLAANRFLIQIQSESIHFAQYGFVAFFFSLVLNNPRQGFLVAVFCGFLDEAHQWWYMYFHDVNNLLDWGDMCLNACGAAGGALPFTSFGRVRRYAEGRENQFEGGNPLKAAGFLAALAGLLVYLKLGTNLGHFDAWPFWKELKAHKPWHELSPRDGMPALLCLSMVFYFLVDDRRRAIPVWALALGLLGFHLGVKLPDDSKGEDVHENVPTLTIPHLRQGAKIAIDGKLDESEWAGAATLSLGSFAPDATEEAKKQEPSTFGPDVETKVRALWDERALYLGFECASDDVWARDLPHDHPEIANTPCVEVFLDLDGAEQSYYEIEVSAANRVQDLFVYWPETPAWSPDPQDAAFVGLSGWDCKGLETKVSVQGELDLGIGSVRTLPKSQGYTVEMAIPWTALRGRVLKEDRASDGTAVRTPVPGSRFRGNFYRVEIRRPSGPNSYEAWSPVHYPLDFHRPAFFGIIELAPQEGGPEKPR